MFTQKEGVVALSVCHSCANAELFPSRLLVTKSGIQHTNVTRICSSNGSQQLAYLPQHIIPPTGFDWVFF